MPRNSPNPAAEFFIFLPRKNEDPGDQLQQITK